MFTKTQLRIMQVFVSQITEKFSINKIADTIKKPYALVHRSVLDLIKKLEDDEEDDEEDEEDDEEDEY